MHVCVFCVFFIYFPKCIYLHTLLTPGSRSLITHNSLRTCSPNSSTLLEGSCICEVIKVSKKNQTIRTCTSTHERAFLCLQLSHIITLHTSNRKPSKDCFSCSCANCIKPGIERLTFSSSDTLASQSLLPHN